MKDPDLISICLPTKNSRACLEKRVASILAQTYTNWEVVHVDTDSTDGTLEYLQAHIPADRLRSFQHPPGLYQAWNRCVEESRGAYIHFATADDYEHPEFYERTIEALNTTGADIASTQYRAVNEAGDTLYTGYSHPVYEAFYGYRPGRIAKRPQPAAFLFSLLFMYPATICNGSLIRRSVFDRAGFFPTDYGPVGDWGWWLRASALCATCTIDEDLAAWTMGNGQATATYARFSRYRKELSMLCETIRDLRAQGALDNLTPAQSKIVNRFEKRAQWVLNGPAKTFLLRLAIFQPDKLLHAISKKRRINYTPFWFTRLNHASVLRSLSYEA